MTLNEAIANLGEIFQKPNAANAMEDLSRAVRDVLKASLKERIQISDQQVIDAGMNVWGMHLFLESIGRSFRVDPAGDNTLQFRFWHRGVECQVKIEVEVLDSAGPKPEGRDVADLEATITKAKGHL